MNDNLSLFTNPAALASYTHDTRQKVPGLDQLHLMTTILLAERAKPAANILVVGAGGGIELKAMAEAQPSWRFTGVDPSAAMLDIARQTTARHSARILLRLGTVDQLPATPFDGATCLLTLHFLTTAERLHLLKEIRLRLKPGGLLVIAHHTAPDGDPERWLARSATFALPAKGDGKHAAASAKAMAERLPLLSPQQEEDLLREAGFTEPALFYAAFSFRGWASIAG